MAVRPYSVDWDSYLMHGHVNFLCSFTPPAQPRTLHNSYRNHHHLPPTYSPQHIRHTTALQLSPAACGLQALGGGDPGRGRPLRILLL